MKSFACLNFREWAKFAKFLDVVLANVWAPKVKGAILYFVLVYLDTLDFRSIAMQYELDMYFIF